MTQAALVLVLASYLYFLRGDVSRLPLLRRGSGRAHRYRLMAGKAFVLFGVVGIAALALAGEADAPWTFPAALEPARAQAIGWTGEALPFGEIAAAMAGGICAGGVVAALAERRGRRVTLGDHGALLPRTPRELAWGVLLSVNAGVSEEVFFRLAVPFLVARVTGNAVLGCAAGALLFAAAHRYQGWVGVAATFAAGALLTLVYLVTGSLPATIAVHVVIDLNALVLRPVLSGRVRWAG